LIYEDYLLVSELHQWSPEKDVPWEVLDPEAARAQTEILDQLRESALIEAMHPVTTKHLMGLLWDDVDATAVLSIELFEGFRHFYVLRRYLDAVGHEPAIGDEEIVRARQKAAEAVEGQDLTQELVNFIFSEHFAAYYFVRLRHRASEPVLREIAHLIARDEFRHTQIAQDLLKHRLERDEESADRVLEAAAGFRHYGSMALEEVPVFQRADLGAIKSFMKKIEALTGRRVVDYLKDQLPEEP
jgi:rubrerythrin